MEVIMFLSSTLTYKTLPVCSQTTVMLCVCVCVYVDKAIAAAKARQAGSSIHSWCQGRTQSFVLAQRTAVAPLASLREEGNLCILPAGHSRNT